MKVTMSHVLRNLRSIGFMIFYASLMYANTSSTQVVKYNLVSGEPDIYLCADAEKIGVTWSNGDVWDKPLIQRFYSLLPTNQEIVVFDLGAQTGSFSLLAKYFPHSIWYSFEPIQEAAEILSKNLVLNDIHNVFVQQMAASNVSGKVTLKMPAMNNWGCSTIGSNVLRFTPVSEREITSIDLDSFVAIQQIKKVHFMKLDTEGSELNILRGAQKMIVRDHPIMLIEYNETNMKQCGVFKQELDQFLKDMGYEWKLISSEDILCIPKICS